LKKPDQLADGKYLWLRFTQSLITNLSKKTTAHIKEFENLKKYYKNFTVNVQ
jgi:hypothetical protein